MIREYQLLFSLTWAKGDEAWHWSLEETVVGVKGGVVRGMYRAYTILFCRLVYQRQPNPV
jgi:hypothetical protein